MSQMYEYSYPSLLQGVSEQLPELRTEGRMTAMVNMFCDPVTGLRRRPSFEFVTTLGNGWTTERKKHFTTNIGAYTYHIVIAKSGKMDIWRVADRGNIWTKVYGSTQAYLSCNNIDSIKGIACQGNYYILNTEKKCVASKQSGNTSREHGFINILVGAFMKGYQFTLVAYNASGTKLSTLNISYTTPDGTASGDASKSIPSYIATQLGNQINSGWGVSVYSNVIYFSYNCNGGWVRVNNGAGSTYASVSGSNQVKLVQELPATMPDSANGYVIAVGSNTAALQYYRWESDYQRWKECSQINDVSSISNFPCEITADASDNIVVTANKSFEGRIAGDDNTNPLPLFIGRNLTGIGSYCGRLVLMCQDVVYLSSSSVINRFMRSSVTEVLADDPIELASGTTTASSFTQGIEYNKDYLLFSNDTIAIIPVNQNGLTAETAQILTVCNHRFDDTVPVTVYNNACMFTAKDITGYPKVFALVPSDYTTSMYAVNPVSDHMPTLLAGNMIKIVPVTTENMALFCYDNPERNCWVHQFMANGDEAVQNAWHKWEWNRFQVDDVFVVSGSVYLFCYNTIGSNVKVDVLRIPFDKELKNNPAVDGELVGDSSYPDTDPTTVFLNDHGEEVKKINATSVGVRFKSYFIPAPAMIFATNTGNSQYAFTTEKSQLLYCDITINKSGKFSVSSKDAHPFEAEYEQDDWGVIWTSDELQPNKFRIGDSKHTYRIPIRRQAHTVEIKFEMAGVYPFNIIDLRYGINVHARPGLRRG